RQVTPVIVKTTTTGRPQPPASSAIQPDKISQLRQLKELMDSGILTEEEFNQQKTKILAS
ncbi:MAG TPA: SHOCT domain-containing protein, partial [Puia sp.]|nr:SHOCT domain-containing protein [Puia sp.]